MTYYQQYVRSITDSVENLEVTDRAGQTVANQDAFEQWCRYTADIEKNSCAVYLIGNGASAMMASHMAADGSKNGGFRAMAFNDPAYLTAVGNDDGYDRSFAVPLARFACPGDMLIAISSSGTSPNILSAIETAREKNITVITLTGMDKGNAARKTGDLNFYVPADTYGLVECSHQVLLHCWLDEYINMKKSQ